VNDEAKHRWLNAAEVFDSWRVVPRLIIVTYITFLIWLTTYFALKYFSLPATERGAPVTAFASVVLTAAFGALAYIWKLYVDNGRDWNEREAKRGEALAPASQ
jgi:uncharacterized BrkB/YihY/UPF0761 family membrane protein